MSNNLLKSSLLLTLILVGGYLLSFGKEAVMAYCFGVSNVTDAFAIAIQVPVILFAFVGVSVRSVVLPTYSKLINSHSKEEASLYISNFISIVLVLGIGILILGEIGAGLITKLLAPGFDEATRNLATNLLRITFPSAVITLIINIISAVLHANKVFIATELRNYLLNIGAIAVTLLLYQRYGIYSAAIGQIIGVSLQLLVIYFSFKTYIKFKWTFDYRNPLIRQTIKNSLPVMWSSSIAEVNTSIVKIIASYLASGSITALNYATKINSIFFSFSSYALATIVFPLYAEASAKEDYKQLNKMVNLSTSIYSFMLIPMSCLLFVFKYDIVKLAFDRGKFTIDDVMLIQSLFGIFSMSLIFMALRETITRVFHSLQDTKTPAKNATLALVIGIALNLILPQYFGIYGLAFATLITSIIISVRLFIQLKNKRKDFEFSVMYVSLTKSIISVAIMTGVILLLKNNLQINPVSVMLISGFVGVVVYLGAQYTMKQTVITYIINSLKKPKINKR